jgi:hypothetical protein
MEFKNIRTYLSDFGNEVAQAYKDKIIKNKVVATGKLRDSIKYKIVETENNIAVYLDAEDYWINIEEGRKPGTYPPTKPLKSWIKLKGLKMNEYQLSKSIKTKGIKAKPFFKNTLNETEVNYEELEMALKKDIDEMLNIKLNQKQNIN